MNLALIKDQVVVAIGSAQTEEDIHALGSRYDLVIDITDSNPAPTVGWVLSGNQLIDPSATAVATRKITKLGMRQRFTFSELVAITGASQSTNANIALPVQVLLGNLSVATYIDLNRADTIGGLNLLVSLGVLTSSRAAEILSAPISSSEMYRGNE